MSVMPPAHERMKRSTHALLSPEVHCVLSGSEQITTLQTQVVT